MNCLISYEILITIVSNVEWTQTGLVPIKHTKVDSFLSCEWYEPSGYITAEEAS